MSKRKPQIQSDDRLGFEEPIPMASPGAMDMVTIHRAFDAQFQLYRAALPEEPQYALGEDNATNVVFWK